MRLASKFTAKSRAPLLQAVKTSGATVLAWFVSQLLLPSELPIFAAMAALLVVQPSINQSLGRAVERSVGVLAGVVLALGISLVFGLSAWIVLLAVVVAVLVSWLLKLTPGTANQVPISAMLVLAIGAATPEYALDRIIETIIGAAVGLAINVLVVAPVLLDPARDAVERLGIEIAATIERLAHALSSENTTGGLEGLMIEARLLRPMQASAQQALKEADESLTLNPRQNRYRARLAEYEHLFTRLGPLVTRVLGMTRALRDHYDDGLHNEPTVRAIAGELERSAHDLRLLVRTVGAQASPGSPPVTEELPALTAPLTVALPGPEHWILIGSLLEDLRRVREEIIGDGIIGDETSTG